MVGAQLEGARDCLRPLRTQPPPAPIKRHQPKLLRFLFTSFHQLALLLFLFSFGTGAWRMASYDPQNPHSLMHINIIVLLY